MLISIMYSYGVSDKNLTDFEVKEYSFNIPMFQFWYTSSAANKCYSSVGHHEQKNKKITAQIKFLAVKIKQQIKLLL